MLQQDSDNRTKRRQGMRTAGGAALICRRPERVPWMGNPTHTQAGLDTFHKKWRFRIAYSCSVSWSSLGFRTSVALVSILTIGGSGRLSIALKTSHWAGCYVSWCQLALG